MIFHGYVSHNQMVNIIHNNRHSPDDSQSAGVTGALPGFAMPKKSPKLWDLAAGFESLERGENLHFQKGNQ